MKIREIKKDVYAADFALDRDLEFIYDTDGKDDHMFLHICRRLLTDKKGVIFTAGKIEFDYFIKKSYFCNKCSTLVGFTEFPAYKTNFEGNA